MTSSEAGQYEHVTSEQCAAYARILREGLDSFGVGANPTSDLVRMLEALEWFGSFRPDSYQPEAALKVDQNRALRSFVLFEQAKRTAVAVGWALAIPGSEKVIRRLKKRLNRLESQDEEALDYFFELDIAHRLARRGIDVKFGDPEPDLIVRVKDCEAGLACKRPRSITGVRDKIRRGANQIRVSRSPGFIVVGTEAVFHMSGDRERPTILYEVETPEQLSQMVEPILDSAVLSTENEFKTAFDKGVRGILFCGLVTGFAHRIVEGYAGFIFAWFHRAISSPQFPGTAEVLDRCIFGPRQVLAAGGQGNHLG